MVILSTFGLKLGDDDEPTTAPVLASSMVKVAQSGLLLLISKIAFSRYIWILESIVKWISNPSVAGWISWGVLAIGYP